MLSPRSRALFACYFLGDTPKIKSRVMMAAEDWRQLGKSEREPLIARINKKAESKRASIGENASRCNFLLAGLAFIIGAAITVMLFTGTSKPSQIVLQVAVSIILFATSFLLLTVSAKGKVIRRKLDYVPTGLQMLSRALEAQEFYKKNPETELFLDYVDATIRLHKCEFILLVERRAVWLATMIAISGLLTMIIGIDLR